MPREIPVTKKLELVKEMDEEFGKKRKVVVNGLPPDFTEKVTNFMMYTSFLPVVMLFGWMLGIVAIRYIFYLNL